MVLRDKIMFKSGFTLIEVMIVIAIVGIMSAVAIPSIINWLPNYRLSSAARDIVSCLQEAKMRAVKENTNVIVIFSSNEYEAFVDDGEGGGNSGNNIKDGSELRIKKVTMPVEIDLSDFNNPGAAEIKLGFNSRGLLATNSGSLLVKNNKSNYRKIIATTAGNIRVEQSVDGTNWN